MRRLSFLVSVVAIIAALCTGPAVAAQGATPAAATPVATPDATPGATPIVQDAIFTPDATDELGLPELRITATDTALEGVPAETAAGRYLVTFANGATDAEGAGVHFMQLPEGVTLEELMAPPTDAASDNRAWFYEVYQAGGAIALPGQTAQVIVDLIPGDYVVWGGFPSLPQAPVEMTVTGEIGSSLPEPATNLTVTEIATDDGGFAFELEGTLVPGLNAIKIINQSDQPHFFFIERYPEPITLDQVYELLVFDPVTMGTPPAGLLDESLLEPQVSAGTQSAGTTQWLAVYLEPGSHIISCFVEDPEMGGLPHAYEGMIDVIHVGVAATPVP